MAKLHYKLWISGEVIGQYHEVQVAYDATRAYIEANPEELPLIHFGAFRSTREGAKPVFSVAGQELVEYLSDVARDEEWDL